jgi:hypothetical protein
MIAARFSPLALTLARRSSISISPVAAVLTTTTFSPAMAALAAFVPCAEAGIRQMLRDDSPRAS